MSLEHAPRGDEQKAAPGVGHNQPPEDPVLAVGPDRAARMLDVSRATFYRNFLDSGKIKSIKVGRRRLVPVAQILALLAEAE